MEQHTYSILNGHNGTYYVLTTDLGGCRLETQRLGCEPYTDYISRSQAAKLLRNWRRDPSISIGRWS